MAIAFYCSTPEGGLFHVLVSPLLKTVSNLGLLKQKSSRTPWKHWAYWVSFVFISTPNCILLYSLFLFCNYINVPLGHFTAPLSFFKPLYIAFINNNAGVFRYNYGAFVIKHYSLAYHTFQSQQLKFKSVSKLRPKTFYWLQLTYNSREDMCHLHSDMLVPWGFEGCATVVTFFSSKSSP